jgi:hypothetical protein
MVDCNTIFFFFFSPHTCPAAAVGLAPGVLASSGRAGHHGWIVERAAPPDAPVTATVWLAHADGGAVAREAFARVWAGGGGGGGGGAPARDEVGGACGSVFVFC